MGEEHFRGPAPEAGLLLPLPLTLLIGRRGKSLIIFRDQNACHSVSKAYTPLPQSGRAAGKRRHDGTARVHTVHFAGRKKKC